MSHAYLFVGPDGVGRRMAARLFAQAINCETETACGHCRSCRDIATDNHPDVRFWDMAASEKTFKVEQVRDLIASLALQPYQARRKVTVLCCMDAVGPAGANALLKTLEEPPSATTLILIATDLDSLLPTILSRCQVIPFGLSPMESIASHLQIRFALSPELALAAAHLSQGRMGEAIALASAPLPPLKEPTFPEESALHAWADALAAMGESDQLAALDSLLAWIRDVAWLASEGPVEAVRHGAAGERLAGAAESVPLATWLSRAQAVEAARAALGRHGNSKLVFDRLARALVAPGHGPWAMAPGALMG